jgi:hypothetical protein
VATSAKGRRKREKKKKNDQLTRNSTDDQRGREDEKERHKDACKARLWHALQIHAHRALLDFRHCNRRTVSPTTPQTLLVLERKRSCLLLFLICLETINGAFTP